MGRRKLNSNEGPQSLWGDPFVNEEVTEDPRFNTAVWRAFQVLNAFQPGEVFLSNAELSDRTGVPKATISRITFTLAQLGYLRYSESMGQYEVSPGVLSLCYPVFKNLTLQVIAHPLMQELATEADAMVALGISDRNSVVVVDYCHGRTPATTLTRVGYRLSVANTAMGAACMSAMSTEERGDVFMTLKRGVGSDWNSIATRLETEINQVWERGYCISQGTFNPAYSTVAVPYFVPAENRIFTIGCSAPTSRFSEVDIVKKWAPRLLGLMSKLSGSGEVLQMSVSR